MSVNLFMTCVNICVNRELGQWRPRQRLPGRWCGEWWLRRRLQGSIRSRRRPRGRWRAISPIQPRRWSIRRLLKGRSFVLRFNLSFLTHLIQMFLSVAAHHYHTVVSYVFGELCIIVIGICKYDLVSGFIYGVFSIKNVTSA